MVAVQRHDTEWEFKRSRSCRTQAKTLVSIQRNLSVHCCSAADQSIDWVSMGCLHVELLDVLSSVMVCVARLRCIDIGHADLVCVCYDNHIMMYLQVRLPFGQ